MLVHMQTTQTTQPTRTFLVSYSFSGPRGAGSGRTFITSTMQTSREAVELWEGLIRDQNPGFTIALTNFIELEA